MPRQRSPSRDEAKRMYLDSKGKMLLKDIAKAVGKQDTQIRRWKSLDHWDEELKGNVTIPKDNVTKQNNGIEKPPKTELLPEEIETLNNEELTAYIQRIWRRGYEDGLAAAKSQAISSGSGPAAEAEV